MTASRSCTSSSRSFLEVMLPEVMLKYTDFHHNLFLVLFVSATVSAQKCQKVYQSGSLHSKILKYVDYMFKVLVLFPRLSFIRDIHKLITKITMDMQVVVVSENFMLKASCTNLFLIICPHI